MGLVMSVSGADKKQMTKMDAAIEQIDAAIVHFCSGEYACAITLAGAAEDQIVHKEEDHIWEILKRKVPAGQSENQ
jgi:hypothetical protein